jgi:TRAP transporter TAXI family solute receptor
MSGLNRRRLLAGAALAVPAARRALAYQGALVMGTGRPGGSYALYGPAWGHYAQMETGVAIAFHASGGAAADILLIEEGAADLGMTTLDIAAQAHDGTGAWTAGAKLDQFRALFPMYASSLQIVALHSSGIATLADLAGRLVGIGPDGGSGAIAIPAVLSSVGATAGRYVTGDMARQIADLAAGRLEACAFLGEAPQRAIAALASHQRLNLIGFSEAEAAQVARRAPGMGRVLIAAGAFPGQNVAVATVGTTNFAICAPGLPDRLAQGVTAAALRNRTALATLVPAAATVPDAAGISALGIVFHAGAIKALNEAGVKV